MSSIKLKHSGGNSVSLNPPTSAPTSSEVAFKLPNEDGSNGQYMKTDGSGNLSFAGAGIAMADQYRLTSNLSLSANTFTTITSNWERPDQSGWGSIGTGMSESGGTFTFPQTGIYKITYFPLFDTSNTVSNAWSYINCTINNSSFITFALACVSMQSGQMNSTALETYFDVTDVSTHKVQFQHYANVACYVSGNSDANRTSASFIRLGDT